MAAVDCTLPVMHPVWTWCAWWASTILNRFAVRDSGRTSYELIIGHRTKNPVVAFGEHVLWRFLRSRNPKGKFVS